jgi:DNA-binding NtrC family response regulator
MAKRIFVVDDENCVADTLAEIFRKAGYDARAFYDAQNALAQIDTCCPELVISDVRMPGMDGIDMAVLIRERHPSCKVVLFSGHCSTLNILEKVGRRGYDFELLAKPISPDDLLARIETVSRKFEAELEISLSF